MTWRRIEPDLKVTLGLVLRSALSGIGAQAAGTSVSEIESTYSHVLTTKKFHEKKVVFKTDGDWEVIKQLAET
jgi:hypothetical protein